MSEGMGAKIDEMYNVITGNPDLFAEAGSIGAIFDSGLITIENGTGKVATQGDIVICSGFVCEGSAVYHSVNSATGEGIASSNASGWPSGSSNISVYKIKTTSMTLGGSCILIRRAKTEESDT